MRIAVGSVLSHSAPGRVIERLAVSSITERKGNTFAWGVTTKNAGRQAIVGIRRRIGLAVRFCPAARFRSRYAALVSIGCVFSEGCC